MITEDKAALAERVMSTLEKAGAVRSEAENTEPGAYVTVQDLCDQLGLFVGDWRSVKRYMHSHHYPITYLPGKGHYIGGSGEEIMNTQRKKEMAEGWAAKLPEYNRELSTCSSASKGWLTRYHEKRAEKMKAKEGSQK